MARLLRSLSVVIAIGIVLSSCASESDNTIPFSTEDIEPVSIPDTLVETPSEDLSGDERRLVRVHSAWLCELQARTFADPGEIPAALNDHLASFQVTLADYQEFTASLPGRQDLRKATLFAVQQACFGR